MAIGTTELSGAFTLDDTGRARIKEFFADKHTISGSSVLVLPDANSGKVWVGTVEGGGA